MAERKRRRAPSRVAGLQHARNRAYGHSFQRVRPFVLARDNYECQIRLPGCTRVATVVDHIRPWQETGPTSDPSLLRAACRPCNARVATRLREGQDIYGVGNPSRDWFKNMPHTD
jgi:5-methylcytosine-specific restriction endonuclease McrA